MKLCWQSSVFFTLLMLQSCSAIDRSCPEVLQISAVEQQQLDNYIFEYEFLPGCVTEALLDLSDNNQSLCQVEAELGYDDWLKILSACRADQVAPL